jgi:hypothetical protein
MSAAKGGRCRGIVYPSIWYLFILPWRLFTDDIVLTRLVTLGLTSRLQA